MSAPVSANERLNDELALLEAMYPEQITFVGHAREVKYITANASFLLRLPDSYPADEHRPEVLHATIGKTDFREALKGQIEASYGEVEGAGEVGEVLDSIVLAFDELCEEHGSVLDDRLQMQQPSEAGCCDESNGDGTTSDATIIVWLHHLLNTNKRKQALSPSSSTVTGVTKPGYPGVLIYSGPGNAVREHVEELKRLNWQAFQVRLESDEEWTFGHGAGVVEVETMKEVVGEVGEERKDMFLAAMRMK